MSTYIIAIFSHHEGDNQIFEVEADTAPEAAKKALICHCAKEYRDKAYLDWVEGLGDSYEDIQDNAVQGELVIANYCKE